MGIRDSYPLKIEIHCQSHFLRQMVNMPWFLYILQTLTEVVIRDVILIIVKMIS